MEGSSRGKAKLAGHADSKIGFERAGLSPKAVNAWQKASFRPGGNFKRDVVAATKYWRAGAELLAKLPGKPKRSAAQKQAAEAILRDCRGAREDFLKSHAETVYRKLTKNLANF